MCTGRPDDRSFEEGAGNEAYDRMAVIQRIEVIVLRLRTDGIPSVQHRVAEALERHTLPLLAPLGMRTHENARVAKAFIRDCA